MGAASTAAVGGVGKLPWRDDLLGASNCSRAAVVATGCSQTLSKQLGPSTHHDGGVFAAIDRWDATATLTKPLTFATDI